MKGWTNERMNKLKNKRINEYKWTKEIPDEEKIYFT